MCRLPDHGRVIAIDRLDDIGVPTLEATHCQWPQSAEVEHLMTRGIGVWQHAREACVASSEVVKIIGCDRPEAPALSGDSLARTGTREDENIKSLVARKGRDLVWHRAEIEDVDVIRAADHVVVAKFHQDLWGHFAPLIC